jgi:DNA-binding FadR family transcriptional regulator
VAVLDADDFPDGGGRSIKTSEIIARELANHIVDRELVEGTRLPPEHEMLEIFRVGRTTLREALRLLETRGVITIRAGRHGGPVVRRPRPADLSESLTLILQFEQSSLADVLVAREALEPVVARLAAERITDEALAVLRSTVDAMLANIGDQRVFLRENRIFHSTIAEASGSVVFSVFNDTLKSIADGAVVGVEYTPSRRRAVAQAHLEIIEALERRDPLSAESAMREHVEAAGRYWKAKYADIFNSPVRWAR